MSDALKKLHKDGKLTLEKIEKIQPDSTERIIAEDLNIRFRLIYLGNSLRTVDRKDFEVAAINKDKAKASWHNDGVNNAPYFTGYTTKMPDNFKYVWRYGSKLNGNKPLPFDIEGVQGDCSLILKTVEHVCGQYSEAILEYIKIMIERPWVKLPIVMLLSKENETGKSSLLELIGMILGANAKKIRTIDITGRFNGPWVTKQFVYVDEQGVGHDKWAQTPIIKDLCTAEKGTAEGKGIPTSEVDINVKLWLASNDIWDGTPIEATDTRIWPIQVPRLKKGTMMNRNEYKRKMYQQIPAFLHYLRNNIEIANSKHRLHFDPKMYSSEFKQSLIDANRSSLSKDINGIFRRVFYEHNIVNNRTTPTTEFLITITAIKSMLGKPNLKTNHIEMTIRKHFNFEYKGAVKQLKDRSRYRIQEHSVSPTYFLMESFKGSANGWVIKQASLLDL